MKIQQKLIFDANLIKAIAKALLFSKTTILKELSVDLLGLVNIALGIYAISIHKKPIASITLFIIGALIILLTHIVYCVMTVRSITHENGISKGDEAVFVLGDQGILIHTKAGNQPFRWNTVTAVTETNDLFVFTIAGIRTAAIKKQGLTREQGIWLASLIKAINTKNKKKL